MSDDVTFQFFSSSSSFDELGISYTLLSYLVEQSDLVINHYRALLVNSPSLLITTVS